MKPRPLALAPAIVALAAAAFAAAPARAQDLAALRSTVATAVDGSPTLAARLAAWQAAGDGLDAARADRGPRIDLAGEIGQQHTRVEGAGGMRSLERHALGLQLTQVLWDGRQALAETRRAGHEQAARFWELLDATEQVALEAARARVDVQRYARLVRLAESNLARHREAHERIEARVRAGVGRGVDLEQARARLALAQSNLVTERSNFHDVAARYRRLVGMPPPASDADEPPALLLQDVPATLGAALAQGLAQSPAVRAHAAAARAAQAAQRVRAGALEPRVELRVRSDHGRHVGGAEQRDSDTAAEIVLNWNLYDGGAGRARARQRAAETGQAVQQGLQACRDLAQTLAIAYHDTERLAEQRELLQLNAAAIERARDAYRQQFEIGQRSLLDLLNAEDEAYTARRSLLDAEADRAIAHLRLQAGLGQLLTQLGVAGPAPDPAAAEALEGPDASADPFPGCPASTSAG